MGKAMLSKSLTQFLGGAVFPPCSLAVLQLEPCPCGRSLQTCASAGDTQALKGRSGSVSSGGHCSFPSVLVLTGFRLHPPRISGRDLILNAIVKKKKMQLCPSYNLVGAFPLPLEREYLFWWDLNFSCRLLKDELPRLIGAKYATRENQRNSSIRNEEAEQKQKQCQCVDVSGGESKA